MTEMCSLYNGIALLYIIYDYQLYYLIIFLILFHKAFGAQLTWKTFTKAHTYFSLMTKYCTISIKPNGPSEKLIFEYAKLFYHFDWDSFNVGILLSATYWMLVWLGLIAHTQWVYYRKLCVLSSILIISVWLSHFRFQQGECSSLTLAYWLGNQLSSLWKFQKQALFLFNIGKLKYRLKSHMT